MKAALLLAALFLSIVCFAQKKQDAKGTVERILVHGKGLEGNLEGDSPDRYVSVYLPPSYKTNPKKRYPVVYFLHGYTDSDDKWYGPTKHWINLPHIADSIFATGKLQEAIYVTPNAFTRFQGSMYSNSITTGNWEDYVANELVAYIDAHYRTIAKAESRGLAGHSMGGYGTMRIGQKHPEIFSSLYMLSPCCLVNDNLIPPAQALARIEAIKDTSDFIKADFLTKIIFASAAAWSPNPVQSPFHLDLPVKDGKILPDVIDKWTANRPMEVMDQYITNIKQLKAVAFDAGNQDMSIAASIRTLDTAFNAYNIPHDFEIYNGNHTNHIADRLSQKVLLFFSTHLKSE